MNETQQIESYLLNNLEPSVRLLMDARLLLDPTLREKTAWQEKTYLLVKAYGRQQLKKEIEAVSLSVFRDNNFKNFRKEVSGIFNLNL